MTGTVLFFSWLVKCKFKKIFGVPKKSKLYKVKNVGLSTFKEIL